MDDKAYSDMTLTLADNLDWGDEWLKHYAEDVLDNVMLTMRGNYIAAREVARDMLTDEFIAVIRYTEGLRDGAE